MKSSVSLQLTTDTDMKTIAVCSTLLLVAGVLAEPPVRNYLPPGTGGYPSGPGGSGGSGGYPSGPGGAGGSGGYPGGAGGAGGYPGGAGGAGGAGGDGPSEPANYEFSYEVKDEASGNDFGHSESRQGDVAKGKYYVLLPDGRKQIVEYTADVDGYKPTITYEGEINTGGAGGAGGAGGYPSGPGGSGSGGYPSGPGGSGSGGYPSGPGGSGSGGYPSGPGGSGSGGYPSGPGGSGGNDGYRY